MRVAKIVEYDDMSAGKDLVAAAAAGGLGAAASGKLAVYKDGNNPFTQQARAEGVSDGVYVRFNGNSGEYIVTGSNDITLRHGDQLAFLMYHIKLAWLGFNSDNKPFRGPEVSLVTGAALPDPDPADFPDDIRWNKVALVTVRLLDGSPQMILSAKAEKPTRPIWRLIKEFGEKMGKNVDPVTGQNKIPIVEIGGRSFQIDVEEEVNGKKVKMKATKWGDTYKIVDWATEAEMAEAIEANAVEADARQDAADEAQQAQQEQEIIPPPPVKPAAKPAAPDANRFRAGRAGQRN